MILGVIGVALAAAVVTYVVLRVIRPPEPRVAPPMTTVAVTTTTTTLPEGPAITHAELTRLVDELIPFVERTRQLSFQTRPSVILSDDRAYTEALTEFQARSGDWLDRLSVPFDVLGLNSNDAEMAGALAAFTGDKSAVFYDSAHAIVHVRAVPATPYLSTMLVVGLTQELDDQHFDTDAVARPSAYGDATFGLATLAGGDAWRIAAAWADTLSADDQIRLRDELSARRGNDGDTSRVPSALAGWLRYPADAGVRFTANMVTARSSGPLDAAFRSPPDGSAQVLSPGRFTAPIDQLEVATPDVDGEVLSSGTFGQFFLESFLRPVVPDAPLDRALSGYRGDTLVAYSSSGSGACIRMDITTGDSPPDNMFDAVDAFAAQREGTTRLVDDPDRPDAKLVRLDLCAGGGSDSDDTTTTTQGETGPGSPSTGPGGQRP